MYHSKQSLNKHAVKQIYASFIYPYLTHCQTVWGVTHKGTLKPLSVARNQNVRTILGLKFDHMREGFADFMLLK